VSRTELWQQHDSSASGDHEFDHPQRIHVKEWRRHQNPMTIVAARADAGSYRP